VLINTGISIDGTDITNMIAHKGVKWSRNDIDGPSAGRTISGLMIRDRVATKIRLDITCRVLNSDELHTLLNLIMPEFVNVTYEDPQDGLVTRVMYANNNSAEFLLHKSHTVPDELWYITPAPDTELWYNISFPLVER